MTCDPADLITSTDLSNLKLDITTIDNVVDSSLDTTTTKSGTVVNTLLGQLKELGYIPPVTYAGGIVFLAGDNTKTVEESGVVYAPLPSALPFTTSGTFIGDDDARFFVVQGLVDADLVAFVTKTELAAAGGSDLVGLTANQTVEDRFNESKHIFNYMTFAEIVDVQTRSGTLDVTTACQNFFDAVGNGTGIIPDGRYYIERVVINNQGGVLKFNNSAFVGIGTAAEPAVIEYTGHDTTFLGIMTINGQRNSNYTSGLKWHSIMGQTPAGSAIFETLKITGVKIGILYGQIDGTPVIGTQQSENHIKSLHMTEIEKAIYYNQPGGLLNIHGGTLTVAKGSWGASYIEVDARIVEKYVGGLVMGLMQINMTNNPLGLGFENKGGSLDIVGGNWEIASTALKLSGGAIYIGGIASDVSSQPLIPFCELVDGTSGTLTISGFKWAKTSGNEASDQGLLEVNTTPDWDVNLTDVYCENQNRNSLIKSFGKNNTWVTNITFNNVRTRAPAGDLEISTTPYNLLDTVPTNSAAVDNLWWNAGTAVTATDAEVPTVAGRVYDHSIKVDASATTVSITNVDTTSAATVIATGMRVTNGKKYLCEGWIKQETGGTGSVKFRGVSYTNAGAAISGIDISDETEFVGETWTYIRGVLTVDSNAAFLGIGISVSNDIGYFVDLKVSRVD